MDLEHELTEVMRRRDTPPPVADPVPAVRAGMRRRRRTQRLQALTAGVGVVVVAMGAALLVGNPLASSSKPLPAATHAPAPSDRSAVPAGFVAQDLTFVTTQHGWALGTAPCGTASCTVQLVTTDGGTTWVRRAAVGLPTSCALGDCVTRLRFADTRIGYAFGPSLYITNDGGAHWSPQSSSPVFGLEIAGGTVSRVVSREWACPGCTFVVQTSEVGSFVWHTAASSDRLRRGAAMARRGSRIAVPLFTNPAGDAQTAVFLSADAGKTWVEHEDPCSEPATEERDALQVSLGPDGLVVVLCQTTLSDETVVRVSTDGGRTYGVARSVPGVASRVTAVSAGRLVAESVTDGRAVLLLSRDGGVSWERVAAQPQPVGPARVVFLEFSSQRTGTWLGPDGSVMWRTSDGGSTWVAHPFLP